MRNKHLGSEPGNCCSVTASYFFNNFQKNLDSTFEVNHNSGDFERTSSPSPTSALKSGFPS